ncbi:hypothetical protein AGR1A_Lc70001 [Agrobacterium fabacearum CFBP 5771]|nr:hypothetical protein AGR1A_Lc70001 [Agrobacterium fabacearum CFBP 5771]
MKLDFEQRITKTNQSILHGKLIDERTVTTRDNRDENVVDPDKSNHVICSNQTRKILRFCRQSRLRRAEETGNRRFYHHFRNSGLW